MGTEETEIEEIPVVGESGRQCGDNEDNGHGETVDRFKNVR